MLGKNPNPVQNVITCAQKKDVELHIIEGLHSHDPGHEINNIASKQKTTLDPAMPVALHTLYEIEMNQYTINVDQT